MYNGTSYSIVAHRFGNLSQAISFNNGFLQVPPGVYFSSDLTIILWINLRDYNLYSQIIDFVNNKTDNVMLGMFHNTSQIRTVIKMNKDSSQIYSPTVFSLNQWYHVALSLNENNGRIYTNGQFKGNANCTSKLYVPRAVVRTNNFIGKNNWNDSYANAIYDDIKIYQGAMTASEVLCKKSY